MDWKKGDTLEVTARCSALDKPGYQFFPGRKFEFLNFVCFDELVVKDPKTGDKFKLSILDLEKATEPAEETPEESEAFSEVAALLNQAEATNRVIGDYAITVEQMINQARAKLEKMK